MIEETSEAVVGCTPEGEVHALVDKLDLVHERCGVLLLFDGLGSSNFSETLLPHGNNVALDLGKFL